MNIRVMGIDYPHKPCDFCRRASYDEYVICLFSTPFCYEKDGILMDGEEGDILIHTPGHIIFHGPRPTVNLPSKNDWIHLSGEDFAALLKTYPLPLNTAFTANGEYDIRKYMARIFNEYKAEDIGREDMINSLITEMIIKLYRNYTNSAHVSASDAIFAVRRKMLHSPERKWSIKELAHLSGYSESRFCELYKKMYKTSPVNDLINMRISLAKRLLYSGASVTETAQICGFETINYFSKHFKKFTGQTPSEYKKS